MISSKSRPAFQARTSHAYISAFAMLEGALEHLGHAENALMAEEFAHVDADNREGITRLRDITGVIAGVRVFLLQKVTEGST